MCKVLIAGATGYLGSHVLKETQLRGHRVRVLARNATKIESMLRPEDELRIGQITDSDTLAGVCDGVDIVFSSVGITKQKDNLTFKDVDYQGNLNLLHEAVRAGVKKFVYVSVYNGTELKHLDIVKAHEDFVDCLKASGINYTIIRPTGYFSDMGEFMTMARKGRVYLIGDENNRMNPIHGSDLASVCVDGFHLINAEVNAGGPNVLRYRDMAAAAFDALGTRQRVSTVPVWLMRSIVFVTRLFNRHEGELLAFFVTMMTSDMVAPRKGQRTLQVHFCQLANQKEVAK